MPEGSSNLIFFIQTSKRLVQVITTLSQIDIAFMSLVSSQVSASLAIKYLLDNKTFQKEGYTVIQGNYPKYESINETSPINI